MWCGTKGEGGAALRCLMCCRRTRLHRTDTTSCSRGGGGGGGKVGTELKDMVQCSFQHYDQQDKDPIHCWTSPSMCTIRITVTVTVTATWFRICLNTP